MRLPLLIASIALVFVTMSAQADTAPLTADQIIQHHIEARGGYASIKALRNLVYTGGTYQEGDYSSAGDAAMSLARPWFKLVGRQDAPGDYMEGYDGSAWEWIADPGIVVRTVGAASGAIRHYAGVEGPLVDYRAKGSEARLLGEVSLDDAPVFVVELTRRDGFVEQLYIDKASFLVVASGGSAPIHAFGDAVTKLTRIDDYRRVAGVLIPHRFATVRMPSGENLSSMQWGRVEANVDLPPDWFSPPEFQRTPLQSFTEKLYEQRSDPTSMMWTYHEFRLANPHLETVDAANVAGFQALKMDQPAAAIALLEQNIRDYPASAGAHFGLGRAYRSAGRVRDARVQFQRALTLDPQHAHAKRALAGLDDG